MHTHFTYGDFDSHERRREERERGGSPSRSRTRHGCQRIWVTHIHTYIHTRQEGTRGQPLSFSNKTWAVLRLPNGRGHGHGHERRREGTAPLVFEKDMGGTATCKIINGRLTVCNRLVFCFFGVAYGNGGERGPMNRFRFGTPKAVMVKFNGRQIFCKSQSRTDILIIIEGSETSFNGF
jgi:hypothetical protein